MKLKIQSIKDYFKSKKDRGLKPIFFEKIGDQNTSREQILKNLGEPDLQEESSLKKEG